MDAVTKDKLLGEAYFMRAYHYFNLVRLWGEVPLKTSVTSDLSDVKLPLATQEAVYERIERDLTRASELMAASPWTSTDGRVTRGAVYTLLAKVYLTMAGYPLQKGAEYYAKAYETAHEVYASGQFYLFPDYAALRDPASCPIPSPRSPFRPTRPSAAPWLRPRPSTTPTPKATCARPRRGTTTRSTRRPTVRVSCSSTVPTSTSIGTATAPRRASRA